MSTKLSSLVDAVLVRFPRADWRDDALCNDNRWLKPEAWFAERQDLVGASFGAVRNAAVAMCMACPVRVDCAVDVVDGGREDRFGIRAGLSVTEQQELTGRVVAERQAAQAGQDGQPEPDGDSPIPTIKAVQDHISSLVQDHRISQVTIAAISGVSDSTVGAIRRGSRRYISDSVARAIMSVTPERCQGERSSDAEFVAEVERAVSAGKSMDDAAEEMGYKVASSMARRLKKLGRVDLLARFPKEG